MTGHLKISEILNERGKTHGDFQQQAATSQALKDMVVGRLSNRLENRPDLDPALIEALEMVLLKVSRICNGDPYEIDHWRDICGYSQLAVDALVGKKYSVASQPMEGTYAPTTGNPYPPGRTAFDPRNTWSINTTY